MRRPSRLTSTICGPPLSGVFGCLGCAAWRTIPPICREPVFFGCNGSETSYCRNSPVPKQETYKKRSSSERLMSVISGGTALKPCSSGGKVAESAGSAGIAETFFCPRLTLARSHTPTEDEGHFH